MKNKVKYHTFFVLSYCVNEKKAVYLHCVFHGIRFKVNERLVVEMTTFFFKGGYIRSGVPPFSVRSVWRGSGSEKNTILFLFPV